MTDLILVVDGGRSHLRAFALSPTGEEAGSYRGAGVPAVHSDWEWLAERLAEVPARVAKAGGFSKSKIKVAVAGLAGMDREEDQRETLRLLRHKGSKLNWVLESDARQTLRAAEPERAVAVGLFGTGSAFFARDEEGAAYRMGGWGALLEDWGGGFEIARRGFIAVFRAHDGSGPATTLTESLLGMAGAESPPDFLKLLYADAFQPSFWARFSPAVLRAAEQGDGVAQAIVDKQTDGAANLLKGLVPKANLPSGTAIHLTGGVVEGSEYFRDRLTDSLRLHLPAHPCGLLAREAYWGGWELGKTILEGKG